MKEVYDVIVNDLYKVLSDAEIPFEFSVVDHDLTFKWKNSANPFKYVIHLGNGLVYDDATYNYNLYDKLFDKFCRRDVYTYLDVKSNLDLIVMIRSYFESHGYKYIKGC